MNAERLRTFLLTLPHVVETVQWSGSIVYWVGDKKFGGKMFALIRLDDPQGHNSSKPSRFISYCAGAERYKELLELDGLHPAPYLSRAYWVATEHWDVFREKEWEQELRAAHAITLKKLPNKTRQLLESI